MCCFSSRVERVSGTRIFARSAPSGGQLLVYSMSLQASEELAMILPLPVPPRSPEDGVRFISLEHYPLFFDNVQLGFEQDVEVDLGVEEIAEDLLEVHEVGAFEASFVPTVDDFERLDRRFRLPRETWGPIALYRDFGFAVFKLKDPRGAPQLFHPMAFEFPRRDPRLLFFPTVHIHDGSVHPTAHFDHVLYCQSDPAIAADLPGWARSTGPARTFLYPEVYPGFPASLVDLDAHCYRRAYSGEMPNRDIVLGGSFALDAAA